MLQSAGSVNLFLLTHYSVIIQIWFIHWNQQWNLQHSDPDIPILPTTTKPPQLGPRYSNPSNNHKTFIIQTQIFRSFQQPQNLHNSDPDIPILPTTTKPPQFRPRYSNPSNNHKTLHYSDPDIPILPTTTKPPLFRPRYSHPSTNHKISTIRTQIFQSFKQPQNLHSSAPASQPKINLHLRTVKPYQRKALKKWGKIIEIFKKPSKPDKINSSNENKNNYKDSNILNVNNPSLKIKTLTGMNYDIINNV